MVSPTASLLIVISLSLYGMSYVSYQEMLVEKAAKDAAEAAAAAAAATEAVAEEVVTLEGIALDPKAGVSDEVLGDLFEEDDLGFVAPTHKSGPHTGQPKAAAAPAAPAKQAAPPAAERVVDPSLPDSDQQLLKSVQGPAVLYEFCVA